MFTIEFFSRNEIVHMFVTFSARRFCKVSKARLFKKFSIADAPGWDKAFNDAEKGLVNALEKVGHTGAAEAHPAAQEILLRIGSTA